MIWKKIESLKFDMIGYLILLIVVFLLGIQVGKQKSSMKTSLEVPDSFLAVNLDEFKNSKKIGREIRIGKSPSAGKLFFLHSTSKKSNCLIDLPDASYFLQSEKIIVLIPRKRLITLALIFRNQKKILISLMIDQRLANCPSYLTVNYGL